MSSITKTECNVFLYALTAEQLKETIGNFVAFEIEPIKILNPYDLIEEVEVCEEEEADYFSVYVRQSNGEAQCIFDMVDRPAAETMVTLLTHLIRNADIPSFND